jgi:glycosyltransferase involved in cell wall biosynthesis
MGGQVYDDRLARVLDLSVVIITQDEAENIAGALESVRWADDIVVVDSGSSDATLEIARRYTDRVTTRAWEGYGEQKNHATGLAAHDWVLSLDADERVSPELAEEIRALMLSAPPMQGYRIPRTTWYLGRWIRSTTWYPDHQLRLYDRRAARWNTRYVHESVTVDGRVGRLGSEIHHYTYRDLSHQLLTIDRYTTLAVKQMVSEHRRATVFDLIVQGPIAFGRNYVLKMGIRDGAPGLIVSVMNAYYVWLKFAKLWTHQRADGRRTRDDGPPHE